MYNFPYLKDTAFLKKFDKEKLKQQFIKVTILNWQEYPLKDFSGQVISGNITLDGSSAMRRTANITFLANELENDLTDLDNDFSINKKVEIMIGFTNSTNEYLQYPILWFPQGIFLIINPSLSYSAQGATISLTLHDKMSLLNGQCGGVFPSSISFHQSEDEDAYGNITTRKLTFREIIQQLIHHWGGEQSKKIIINNIEDKAKEVLRWGGNENTPLYIYDNRKAYLEKTAALSQAFKYSYKKCNLLNIVPFSYFQDALFGKQSKISEIQEIQGIISGLSTTLEKSKQILQIVKQGEENLNSFQNELKKRYKISSDRVQNQLQQLQSNIDIFREYWTKKYQTVKNKVGGGIYWVKQPKMRNKEGIHSIIIKAKTLRERVNTIKSALNTQKKHPNTNKYVTIRPSDIFCLLLSMSKKNPFAKEETQYYKTMTWESKATKKKERIAGVRMSTNKNYYNKYVFIYDKNILEKSWRGRLRIPSQGNHDWLSCTIFNKNSKKKEDHKDILYFCLDEMLQLATQINFPVSSVQWDFHKKVDPIIKNIIIKSYYSDPRINPEKELINLKNKATLTQKEKKDKATYEEQVKNLTKWANQVCDAYISICDKIINNFEILEKKYNNAISQWQQFRSDTFKKNNFSFWEQQKTRTIGQSFEKMIQNEKKILKELVNNLPRELKNSSGKIEKVREVGQNKIYINDNSVCNLLDNIKTYLNNLKFQEICFANSSASLDEPDIWIEINRTLWNKQGVNVKYYIEKFHIPYFKDISKNYEDKSFKQVHKQLNIQLNQIETNKDKLNGIKQGILKTCNSALSNWVTNNLSNYQQTIEGGIKTITSEKLKPTKEYLSSQRSFLGKISTILTDAEKDLIKASKSKKRQNRKKMFDYLSFNNADLVENQTELKNAFNKQTEVLNELKKYNYSYIEEYQDLNIDEALDKTMDKIEEQIEAQKQIILKLQQGMKKTLEKNLTATYSIDQIKKAIINASIQYNKNNVWKNVSLTKAMNKYTYLFTKTERDNISNFFKTYNQERGKIKKYEYNEDVGYALTDFVFPGELMAKEGDTIVSILDKIKQTLGNFEYFYDINGNFIFQEIKNYLNTSYSTFILQSLEDNPPNYDVNYLNNKVIYDFSNGEIISSYSNSPQYLNIKNDFVVWGERTDPSGGKHPIRYHLAIDSKPQVQSYFFFDVFPSQEKKVKNYKYKSNFPKIGNSNNLYYAQHQNKYYKWIKDTKTNYIGYKSLTDRITNNPLCYFYASKANFPTIGKEECFYYDNSTQLLYGYINNNYQIAESFRIKKCTKISSLKNEGRNGKYYLYKKSIYRYDALTKEYIKTQFVPFQSQDYRTEFYLKGMIEEITGTVEENPYYAELKNEWPKLYNIKKGSFYKEALNNQSGIDYFLDLISASSLTAKYGISNIGKRTKVISNNSINCIFEPSCPQIVFIDNNPPIDKKQSKIDQDREKQKQKQEKNQLIKTIETWNTKNLSNFSSLQVDHSIYEKLATGGILRSAYEEIRGQLHEFLSYNQKVSISILPIYYLEPNSLISIYDPKTGISGNYMINRYNISLGIDGVMSLQCSKVLNKI